MARTRILLLLCLALAALVAPAEAFAAPCRGAHVAPREGNLPQAREALRCLLNRERRRHGLGRLRAQKDLRRAAARHTGAMVRGRFFSHVSPGGSTLARRVARTGYARGRRSAAYGENLGWGGGRLGSPARIVAAWMASPGHRANVLGSRWRHVGVGVAARTPSGGAGATWTVLFGARR